MSIIANIVSNIQFYCSKGCLSCIDFEGLFDFHFSWNTYQNPTKIGLQNDAAGDVIITYWINVCTFSDRR